MPADVFEEDETLPWRVCLWRANFFSFFFVQLSSEVSTAYVTVLSIWISASYRTPYLLRCIPYDAKNTNDAPKPWRHQLKTHVVLMSSRRSSVTPRCTQCGCVTQCNVLDHVTLHTSEVPHTRLVPRAGGEGWLREVDRGSRVVAGQGGGGGWVFAGVWRLCQVLGRVLLPALSPLDKKPVEDINKVAWVRDITPRVMCLSTCWIHKRR